MTKIEELEQKLNECQKELTELKKSEKMTGNKWIPEDGEDYYFINDIGLADKCKWGNYEYDNWRYNNIPIFQTKDKCYRYLQFINLVKEKSYVFSKEEWEDERVQKWFIWLHNGELYTKFLGATNVYGSIFFKTKEDAQYIVDNYKEELLKYWL